MLDKEMSLGPVDINLSDIGWPDEIQGVLNRVNDALYTLFILYAMGMGFSGLGLLGCAAGAWWHDSKLVTKGNLVVASLAAGSLLIGSGVITGAVMKGVGKITDLGEHVGVSVSRGNKFLALTWVATVFMALVVVFWGVLFGVQKRNDKKGDRRMSDMSNMSNKIC